MFIRPNGSVTGSILVRDLPVAGRPKKQKEEPQAPPAQPMAAQPPDVHDLKRVWIEYAVSGAPPEKRLSADEAEGLNKAELIELFGGER